MTTQRPTRGKLGLISHPGFDAVKWRGRGYAQIHTFECCECGELHERQGLQWQAHHGMCDDCWAMREPGIELQYEWPYGNGMDKWVPILK